MAALHVTNTLNVEATLNQWIMDKLNALNKPSWLASFTFRFDAPETAMVLPAFSVYHLPVDSRKIVQGDYVGTGKGAQSVSLMDLSCWVSRSNINWSAQLRTMRAFVDQVFAGNSIIQLVDYLTDPANPAAVSYKVEVERVEWDTVVDDPNPDIERARALVRYRWIQRS